MKSPFAVFDAGYRIFFMTAGLFAVLAMVVWEAWLAIHYAGGMVTSMPFAIAPHQWHSHEMVFGYGSLAVAGFLLTAAPNWTGQTAGGRAFFAGLFLVWLAGRLTMWWSGALPWTVTAVADLAFLPVVMLKIFLMLMKRPKGPQMVLLAVLILFWVGNVAIYAEWLGLTDDTAAAGLRAGMFSLSALIVILGGRVTPAFTRNAILRAGDAGAPPANPMKLAAASIGLALFVVLATLLQLPAIVIAVPAVLTGVVALIRLSMWRTAWTLREPILWTLHLSYAMNAAGFILYGLSLVDFGSEIAALHVAGIGGIGGMTLSVMSRATLGHSGRELVAPAPIVIAYVLVPLAAVMRYAGSASPSFYFPGVLLSGALWIIAFVLFTLALMPAFLGMAADPQKGHGQ